jgi:predicted  nucleic acid-binding Zn-ribbon protein
MTSTEYLPDAPPERTHRNWWIWVSAVLAVVVVGLIVWQLNTQSDLDAAQKQVKDLQTQIDAGKQSGSEAAASYQAAYKDLQEELGATQQDLASTQQELDEAQKAADAAAQEAAEAKQRAADAGNATDKAQAEAEQAQAELEASQARATVVKDCANTFVGELATVAQAPDPAAAAESAKSELQGILADCKSALGGN